MRSSRRATAWAACAPRSADDGIAGRRRCGGGGGGDDDDDDEDEDEDEEEEEEDDDAHLFDDEDDEGAVSDADFEGDSLKARAKKSLGRDAARDAGLRGVVARADAGLLFPRRQPVAAVAELGLEEGDDGAALVFERRPSYPFEYGQ